MLIVFEGIDGAGKGAQIRLLRAFLRQHGVRHAIHKYPTKKAKEAFAHLAGRKTIPPLKLAQIFADDIVSEQKKIGAEIASGMVVICDRYLHSTLAYQAVGAGFDALKAALPAGEVRSPDLVILLDLDPHTSAQRKERQKTPDRHEADVEFLSKVRANYIKMEHQNFLSYKYAVIDASEKPEEIFTHVLANVEPLLVKKIR